MELTIAKVLNIIVDVADNEELRNKVFDYQEYVYVPPRRYNNHTGYKKVTKGGDKQVKQLEIVESKYEKYLSQLDYDDADGGLYYVSTQAQLTVLILAYANEHDDDELEAFHEFTDEEGLDYVVNINTDDLFLLTYK